MTNVLAVVCDHGPLAATTTATLSRVERGVLATATRRLPLSMSATGDAALNPEALLEAVFDVGSRVVAVAGEPADVVALAHHGDAVVAWDLRDGRPQSPVTAPGERRTGHVGGFGPHPTGRPGWHDTAARLARPPLRAPHTVVTTVDSWLLRRLTGGFLTDVATVSRCGLLDRRTGQWCEAAITSLGIEAERLPRVAASAEPVGVTTMFGRSAIVAGLAVVDHAMLVGQGADGQCVVVHCDRLGGITARLVNPPDRSRPPARPGLGETVGWRVHGVDTMIRQVHAVAKPGPDGRLDEVAVLLSVRDLVARLATETDQDLTEVRVDGWLARRPDLMRAQADLTRLPVAGYPRRRAAALGVTTLARVGLNEIEEPTRLGGMTASSARVVPRLAECCLSGPGEAAALRR